MSRDHVWRPSSAVSRPALSKRQGDMPPTKTWTCTADLKANNKKQDIHKIGTARQSNPFHLHESIGLVPARCNSQSVRAVARRGSGLCVLYRKTPKWEELDRLWVDYGRLPFLGPTWPDPSFECFTMIYGHQNGWSSVLGATRDSAFWLRKSRSIRLPKGPRKWLQSIWQRFACDCRHKDRNSSGGSSLDDLSYLVFECFKE